MSRRRVSTVAALTLLWVTAGVLYGELLTYLVGRPIRSAYVVPILNLVVLGTVLVIAVASSWVATRFVGPRRRSALIIPTFVGLAALALSFWVIVLVLKRGDLVSPLIAMVAATVVAAYLRRPRLESALADRLPSWLPDRMVTRVLDRRRLSS